MPKTNRSGQALSLTPEQLDSVMAELRPIARAALATCRYTAARVTAALSLRWENVTPTDIVIPKAATKKNLQTRTIPLNPRQGEELANWRARWAATYRREPERADFVFPGHKNFDVHLTRGNVDYALRAVCQKLGIEGCSTHSFRRSALSAASDKGVPLRVIQSISGHSSLETLQRYLNVKDEQKRQAALAFE